MISDQARAVAATIDHTLLKPDATADQIRRLCQEAMDYGFHAVCVNPGYVGLASEILAGSAVRVCTVAGFPLGATMGDVKAFEAQRGIELGAHEVDMVLNIGALRSGDPDRVQEDIAGVVEVCHAAGAICKVILETALLGDAQKIEACRLAVAAGADFVKTSTGFGPTGATVADVALMRAIVGPSVGVKAAGGIRTYEAAQEMLNAGANRLGTSSSVQIVQAVRG
jgi:deoxyribose-phosphate aldolase